MRILPCLSGLVMLALYPACAPAAPVTYSWTGTVTSSSGSPPQGTLVPVSVTLERGYPADDGTPNPAHQATYTGGLGTPSGKSPILAISVAGASALGWFDTVHIEKNLAGTSQIAIQSSLPQCCRAVQFVFSTTMKGVVKSVGIPKTLFPTNFQTSAFAITYTASDVYGGVLQ